MKKAIYRVTFHVLLVTFYGFLPIACTKVEFKSLDPLVYTDDDFTPYIQGFKANYSADFPALTMIFGVVQKDDAGNCNHKTKIILIKKTTWATMSVYRQEALVFHELGHCVLGIEKHNETPDAISFMIPSLNTTEFYKTNRAELFKDLFNTDEPILYELPKTPETKVTPLETIFQFHCSSYIVIDVITL